MKNTSLKILFTTILVVFGISNVNADETIMSYSGKTERQEMKSEIKASRDEMKSQINANRETIKNNLKEVRELRTGT
jgi:hypothetical protein